MAICDVKNIQNTITGKKITFARLTEFRSLVVFRIGNKKRFVVFKNKTRFFVYNKLIHHS